MKKMSFLFLFSLVTMLSFAVDVTGRMRITVVDGITVTENQQLNFGSVDASGVAGTVRVTYDGVRTTTGGVTAVGTGANAGYFSITGIVGTAVSYTVPTTAITMGIGSILKAKKIILVATGDSKAEAIKN